MTFKSIDCEFEVYTLANKQGWFSVSRENNILTLMNVKCRHQRVRTKCLIFHEKISLVFISEKLIYRRISESDLIFLDEITV